MLARPLLALLCASAAIAAQVSYSEGPFAGVPAGISLAPGGPLAEDELWFHDAGFTNTMPHSWGGTMAGRPVFTAAAILYDATRPCPIPSATVDLDAISLGLDWIWADATGHVAAPTGNGVWAALALSVAKGASGATGSVIAGEVARGDTKAGASGDVFTYVLQGSTIPWVDVVHRALDRSEMGLPANADIDALDLYMPLYLLDGAHHATLPPWAKNPNGPTVYFSLSAATAKNAPGAWFGGGAKSPATILQCKWQAGLGKWSCPSVLLSYSDLGLAVNDDIVALAIEQSSTGKLQILLSIPASATRADPILFCEYTIGGSTPVTLYPYTYKGSNDDDIPVSGQMGLLSSDTPMALCGTDPTILQGSAANSYAFGTPWYTTWGCAFPRTMSASAFRTMGAGGNPELRSYLLGSQPNGAAAWALPVLVGLDFDTPPANCWLVPSPMLILPATMRPQSPFCGDPVELVVPLPNGPFAGTPNDFAVLWLGADAAITSIGSAYPVILSLP